MLNGRKGGREGSETSLQKWKNNIKCDQCSQKGPKRSWSLEGEGIAPRRRNRKGLYEDGIYTMVLKDEEMCPSTLSANEKKALLLWQP